MKDGRVCKTNLADRYTCVRHFRDLMNLSRFIDFDKEFVKFKKRLLELGWSSSNIREMETQAASFTVYEQDIPHRIREAGSQKEWNSMKARSK